MVGEPVQRGCPLCRLGHGGPIGSREALPGKSGHCCWPPGMPRLGPGGVSGKGLGAAGPRCRGGGVGVGAERRPDGEGKDWGLGHSPASLASTLHVKLGRGSRELWV